MMARLREVFKTIYLANEFGIPLSLADILVMLFGKPKCGS